jgi:tRNA 2-thiocytidine biosynthesis protein TtcA
MAAGTYFRAGIIARRANRTNTGLQLQEIMDKKDKSFIERVKHRCLATIENHLLIAPGDKLLIGLSGGKDSLVLLEILSQLRKYGNISCELYACHIKVTDMPYLIDKAAIESFCYKREVPFYYIERSYADSSIDKSPCYFCSWTRRQVFFELSGQLGCNKLATGHHMDDAIETMLMNMVYHGSYSSIPYQLPMFGGRLTIIRPLLDLKEEKLLKYAELKSYPKIKTECPYDKTSKRKKTRAHIEAICAGFPQARINMFSAMGRIKHGYLPGQPALDAEG